MRLAKKAHPNGDEAVTDDALLAGFLQTKPQKTSFAPNGGWVTRFFQLRSGTLSSYSCIGVHAFSCSEKASVKIGGLSGDEARWARPDVVCSITIVDAGNPGRPPPPSVLPQSMSPAAGTATLGTSPSPQAAAVSGLSLQQPSASTMAPLLCTQVQAKTFKEALEARNDVKARYIICWRAAPTLASLSRSPSSSPPATAAEGSSAAAAAAAAVSAAAIHNGLMPVVVRLVAGGIMLFDLDDPVEYTLMCLNLVATDEPASPECPFGLVISSGASDDMFVPLKNLVVAAPTPLIVLQWMAALKTADLDPPAATHAAVAASANDTGLNASSSATPSALGSGTTSSLAGDGTRDNRSHSGALLGQLLSNAVGQTSGSFSGLGDMPQQESNDVKKAELDQLLAALKWDSHRPPPSLHEAMQDVNFQRALTAFCQTNFTEEYVNFWLAVEQFRQNRDPRSRQAAARSISAEFISYTGKSVVNIQHTVRRRIEEIINSGLPAPVNVFDSALDEVKVLLEEESWPKFLARLRKLHGGSTEDTVEEPRSWSDDEESSSYELQSRSSGVVANKQSTASSSISVSPGGSAASARAPVSTSTSAPAPPTAVKSPRFERSGSLWNVTSNDFGGEPESAAVDMKDLRLQLSQKITYNPRDPPTLRFLLAKKELRNLMRIFAKTILAEENVNFWETIMRFKYAEELSGRQQYLKVLFEDFIPSDSKTMVNIAGSERSRLMKLYQEQGLKLAEDKEIFNVALEECVKVMELDLYPRFCALLQECCVPNKAAGGSQRGLAGLRKVPPLWEILNDPDELSSLLLFAAANNQQDDILFWCLVQRFRVEQNVDVRNRLGNYIAHTYVSAGAPRMIRVDKAKKAACWDLFEASSKSKGPLPNDLFDALWRDSQAAMNKNLHPAYEKHLRKPKKTLSDLFSNKTAKPNMLKQELDEALKEDEKHQKWVKTQAQHAGTDDTNKKALLGGTRRINKEAGSKEKGKSVSSSNLNNNM